ncbi:MAG: hypothetical protein ACT6FF_00350 [Methanosarcinaceae archaeon]
MREALIPLVPPVSGGMPTGALCVRLPASGEETFAVMKFLLDAKRPGRALPRKAW